VAFNTGRHGRRWRNALVVVELNELDDPRFEALVVLIRALFNRRGGDACAAVSRAYRTLMESTEP